MNTTRILTCAALAGFWLCSAELVAAGILEDFPFDDPDGTAIEAAFNAAGTGHSWDVDDDLAGVVTNGSGQYNASLKSNLAFGSTYVDLDDVGTGSLYGVIELTWDFDSASLNVDENEEIRLSLIQNDPRSTFVTAEVEIERTDADEVIIFGNAVGDGSVDTPSATLSNSQATNFIAVIAANLDRDIMAVSYSADDGATFNTLTGGVLNPARGVASLRLVLNNDLSQDNILLDRVYLTDMNPFPGRIPAIPEPAAWFLLAVCGCTGSIRRRR